MNSERCRFCGADLDAAGFCRLHDYPSFRSSSPAVVLPPGVVVKSVVLKQSRRELTLDQAVTGRFVVLEGVGYDRKLYILRAVDVVVEAEPRKSQAQPTGPYALAVPNYSKG